MAISKSSATTKEFPRWESKLMRKHLVSVATMFALLSYLLTPTSAGAAPSITSPQAKRAIIGLKGYIEQKKINLSTLETNRSQELNTLLVAAKDKAQEIQTNYNTNKAAATRTLADANANLATYSVFKVTVGNLSVCGTNFQTHCEINTIVTIPPTTPQSQVNVPSLLKMGVLVPVDEENYKKSLDSIASIENQILMLDSQFPTDKTNNEEAYKAETDKIYVKYRPQIESLEGTLTVAEKSLIAASRALKSGSDFFNSFTTAYVFDFNYSSIQVVANSTFDAINSLLSLYVVRDAIKYESIGSGIDRSYTNAKAKAYNKYYSDTFFDADFRNSLKIAQNLYLKLAK